MQETVLLKYAKTLPKLFYHDFYHISFFIGSRNDASQLQVPGIPNCDCDSPTKTNILKDW